MGDRLPGAICQIRQGKAGCGAELRQAATVQTHTHTHTTNRYLMFLANQLASVAKLQNKSNTSKILAGLFSIKNVCYFFPSLIAF